jgi:rhomboid family GlyGly-CTERM serine protease
VWRILTGHLVHWNADHLLWDLFALLTLGAFCELRNRRQFIACLAASTLAISLVLLCFASKVVHYRGLSGLDSALYVLAVGSLCGEAWKNRGYLGTAIFAAGLLGLAGKLAYEMTTGQTLFVDAESAGFVPLPLVHAIGGVVGLAILVFAGFASRAGSASWVAHRRANQRSASPLSI